MEKHFRGQKRGHFSGRGPARVGDGDGASSDWRGTPASAGRLRTLRLISRPNPPASAAAFRWRCNGALRSRPLDELLLHELDRRARYAPVDIERAMRSDFSADPATAIYRPRSQGSRLRPGWIDHGDLRGRAVTAPPASGDSPAFLRIAP